MTVLDNEQPDYWDKITTGYDEEGRSIVRIAHPNRNHTRELRSEVLFRQPTRLPKLRVKASVDGSIRPLKDTGDPANAKSEVSLISSRRPDLDLGQESV